MIFAGASELRDQLMHAKAQMKFANCLRRGHLQLVCKSSGQSLHHFPVRSLQVPVYHQVVTIVPYELTSPAAAAESFGIVARVVENADTSATADANLRL